MVRHSIGGSGEDRRKGGGGENNGWGRGAKNGMAGLRSGF